MKFVVTTETREEDIPWLLETWKRQFWAGWLTERMMLHGIKHSLCFWVHGWEDDKGTPVGFARVVTDRAMYSNITDVFIIPEYQKRGLGRMLMEGVLEHPDVGRTNCILSTLSEDFYKKFGFEPSWVFDGRVMKRQRDPS